MAYAHEDEYHDRVPIAPYYTTNIYLDGQPGGGDDGAPSLKLSLSDDEGNQWSTPQTNAQTVKKLRLALARAERWMEKVADR